MVNSFDIINSGVEDSDFHKLCFMLLKGEDMSKTAYRHIRTF
jgi:hypothetical protein